VKTNVTLPDEKEASDHKGDAGKPASGKAVHLDFSKKKDGDGSPFHRAKSLDKRLKVFIWGDTGVGKSTLALRFPGAVVVDLEGGCDLYGDQFEFDVLRASDADEIAAALDWLAVNQHPYRTLVIDPVTIYWDALQKKWSDIFLRRNRGSKGYKFEFYDLQPRDWQTIKAEFKEFIRKLIALDMNVIVTAREKTKYRDGSFMQVEGQTFDGEKSLPYMFDIVLRMYLDDKGRRMAAVLKDRSNKLPKKDFEASYAVFEELFGKKSLNRKAKPAPVEEPKTDSPGAAAAPETTAPARPEPASADQKDAIRRLAGELNLSEQKVTKRLGAYGAASLDELTAENARVIIGKLEAAVARAKPGDKAAGQAGGVS